MSYLSSVNINKIHKFHKYMYYHTNIKKNTHNLNKFLDKDNKKDKMS